MNIIPKYSYITDYYYRYIKFRFKEHKENNHEHFEILCIWNFSSLVTPRIIIKMWKKWYLYEDYSN